MPEGADTRTPRLRADARTGRPLPALPTPTLRSSVRLDVELAESSHRSRHRSEARSKAASFKLRRRGRRERRKDRTLGDGPARRDAFTNAFQAHADGAPLTSKIHPLQRRASGRTRPSLRVRPRESTGSGSTRRAEEAARPDAPSPSARRGRRARLDPPRSRCRVEPVQGEGGRFVPDAALLPARAARDLRRPRGSARADEVQTGSSPRQLLRDRAVRGVEADLVCVGSIRIAAGLPLSGVPRARFDHDAPGNPSFCMQDGHLRGQPGR